MATEEPLPQWKAKRYALRFNPPTVFLEYQDETRTKRVRTVKLNGLKPATDVDKLTRKVIASFPRRLNQKTVKYDQIRRLIVKLINSLPPPSEQSSGGSPVSTSGAASTPPSANGNGVGPTRATGGTRADSNGSSTCKSPAGAGTGAGSPGSRGAAGGQPPPGRLIEVAGRRATSSAAAVGLADAVGAVSSAKVNRRRTEPLPEADATSGELDEGILQLDLNKVSEQELQAAKAVMATQFSQHAILPGDARYVYDRQVEFEAALSDNSWDSGSDDDEDAADSDAEDIDWESIARVTRSKSGLPPETPAPDPHPDAPAAPPAAARQLRKNTTLPSSMRGSNTSGSGHFLTGRRSTDTSRSSLLSPKGGRGSFRESSSPPPRTGGLAPPASGDAFGDDVFELSDSMGVSYGEDDCSADLDTITAIARGGLAGNGGAHGVGGGGGVLSKMSNLGGLGGLSNGAAGANVSPPMRARKEERGGGELDASTSQSGSDWPDDSIEWP